MPLSPIFLNVSELLALAKKLRTLPFEAQLMTGVSTSRTPGPGLDFSHHSPTQSGDDIRHIDWRVSARKNTLYTRHFSREKGQSVHLIVDQSASVAPFYPQLVEMVALAALSCLLDGNRVTIYTENTYSTFSFRHDIPSVISFLSQRPSLSSARSIGSICPPRPNCIIFSDFIRPALRLRPKTLCLQVLSAPKIKLPFFPTLIEYEDAETKERLLCDSRMASAFFANAIDECRHSFFSLCATSRAWGFSLTDTELYKRPYVPILASFFRQHGLIGH